MHLYLHTRPPLKRIIYSFMPLMIRFGKEWAHPLSTNGIENTVFKVKYSFMYVKGNSCPNGKKGKDNVNHSHNNKTRISRGKSAHRRADRD